MSLQQTEEALEWIQISADMAETPMTDQGAWMDNLREKAQEALKAIREIRERDAESDTFKAALLKKIEAGELVLMPVKCTQKMSRAINKEHTREFKALEEAIKRRKYPRRVNVWNYIVGASVFYEAAIKAIDQQEIIDNLGDYPIKHGKQLKE